MSAIEAAENWLRSVDEYDRKSGKLVRERQDPTSKLIRFLVQELKQ